MLKDKIIKGMAAFIFLGVSVCVGSGGYYIDITPSVEQGFYEMKAGGMETFEVSAYKKADETSTAVEIAETILWQYDLRLLEKVSNSQNSITLKAKKDGVCRLKAITIVKNNNCQKEINILINK